MTCGKCGAEYDNTFDKCPYCGEIFKIPGSSDKKQEKKYSLSVRKFARKHDISEEAAEKILFFIRVALGVVGALILLFVCYSIFTGVFDKTARDRRNNLKELQELYSEENYAAIYEKVQDIGEDRKASDYAQYYSIYMIYDAAKNYFDFSSEITELIAGGNKEDIEENAISAFSILARAYTVGENMKAIYGEATVDEPIEKIRRWLITDCENNYKLSEVEALEVMQKGSEEEAVISSYADVVYRRNTQ